MTRSQTPRVRAPQCVTRRPSSLKGPRANVPTAKQILIVTTRYPFPQTGGDKLRIAQLCKILSEEYEVSLVALGDSARLAPPGGEARLKQVVLFRQPRLVSWLLCVVGLFSPLPLQLYYYFNPSLRRYLKRHAHEFDAIVFHLVRSTVFAPDEYDGCTILEMTDCMTLHYERARHYSAWTLRSIFYRALEEARMRRLERNLADRFDAVTVISEVDRDALLALNPRYRDKIAVFPNYIRALPYRPTCQHRCKILFIGNMTALHVLDAVTFFAERVMPRLAARHPGLSLLVIGQLAPWAARRLRRQPNVTLVGPVEHIEDHIDSLLCGIAPMRFASGIQNKVIDYMSLGIPALVSPVALEGIPARDGQEVLVCRNTDDYVWAIGRLLDEQDLWHRIASQGQAFANRMYSREAIAAEVLAAFRKILQEKVEKPSVASSRSLSVRAAADRTDTSKRSV